LLGYLVAQSIFGSLNSLAESFNSSGVFFGFLASFFAAI
jgi:hypothetical protein